MALADYQAYFNSLAAPGQNFDLPYIGIANAVAYQFVSGWLATPFAGVAPTTAAALNNTTTGNKFPLLKAAGGSNKLYIARVNQTLSVGGQMLIYDRLSHTGGLSGVTTGEQTTNLPTAALTRYTSGAGVLALLEIYTAIGSTATTVTARYTNQAGTGSLATPPTTFGGSGYQAANRVFMLPLQGGDIGVRSVEGVTIAATTATAGAFGVTLIKPLLYVPAIANSMPHYMDALLCLSACMEELLATACVGVLLRSTGSGTPNMNLHMEVIEA